MPTDENYISILEKGEGITGLVCQDMSPRYVPRLFLPFSKKRGLLAKLLFSHAIKFEVQDERGILKQKADDIDYFAFEDSKEGELQFRSFVSVPLMSVQAGTCFGSLNFDFDNAGSLDKFDIAMAATFGVLLADEIRRLQPVNKNNGG